MNFPRSGARRVTQGIFLLPVLFTALSAGAAELAVSVEDVDGNPVPNVAVFMTSTDGSTPASAVATMDQVDTRFVPHLLVIQRGTLVEFPNSDTVAHHVYSFSSPNNFVLPLYKGDAHPPVKFEHSGIVTLGCNIHDSMLGYVVVVDTDLYAMTNGDGVVTLDVDGNADAWEISIWSPRIRDSRDPISQAIQAGEELTATFALRKKLRPPHKGHSESVAWDDY